MITYRLTRYDVSDQGITGELKREDTLLCFTLEPPYREEHGAIPCGDYPLTWEMSPRLGRLTPRLNGVPNRSGILIHAGNVISDSRGCILVGLGWSQASIGGGIFLSSSRIAREKVYDLIGKDLKDGGLASLIVEEG